MNHLVRGVSWIVGLLLIAAVAINFSNVFGRYILDEPLGWADEAMGFLQVAMVVIGAALVTRENAHLRMDAVEHLMPERLKRRINIATLLLTVVVALTVVWMSLRIVSGLVENDTRSVSLEIPQAIPYMAFPIGFSLIALFALLRLIGLLRRPRS
jgi:TRAP-type C4-dicarboxylate transport system permease small subunit